MLRNRWLVLLALVGACGKSPGPRDVERERTSRPTRAPARVIDVVAPDAAPDTAYGFRDLAEAIAARTGCRVLAWGTAPIAGDDRPRRFAVLEPEEPGLGRGAYLIEDTASARWLVSFAVDGRTEPWADPAGATRGSDPAWQTREDRVITHAQAGRGGASSVTFALRDGALVVLDDCPRACPLLREVVTDDLDLQVIGPAASVGALIGDR